MSVKSQERLFQEELTKLIELWLAPRVAEIW